MGLAAGAGLKILGSQGSTQGKQPAHLITVSGTATLSSAPDEAEISLGVNSQGTDGSSAFATNAQKMAAIMKVLQKAGVSR